MQFSSTDNILLILYRQALWESRPLYKKTGGTFAKKL